MTLGSVDSANPWLLPRIPLYPENPTVVREPEGIAEMQSFQRASRRARGSGLPIPETAASWLGDRQSNGGWWA